jgi:hypothetical protein
MFVVKGTEMKTIRYDTEGSIEVLTTDGQKGKIVGEYGYTEENLVLAKVKNTGNGYIFKFPSCSPTHQTNYICMDYAEADYIRKLLTAMNKHEDVIL